MIYLLTAALLLAAFGFVRKTRRRGVWIVLLDTLIAAAFGWLSGIFIGVGARIGMWAIPFFNGSESRFTLDGTVQVILVFSLYGIMLGILYELLFRDLLYKKGLLFGLVVAICTWYPLAEAGMQQLNFQPTFISLLFFSGLVMSIMFIPYGIALELLIGRWHQRHRNVPVADPLGKPNEI